MYSIFAINVGDSLYMKKLSNEQIYVIQWLQKIGAICDNVSYVSADYGELDYLESESDVE